MGRLKYGRYLKNPDLENAITRGLIYLVKSDEFKCIDYSRGDIIWIRNLVLEDLSNHGINRNNWNPENSLHIKTLAIFGYKYINSIYNKEMMYKE